MNSQKKVAVIYNGFSGKDMTPEEEELKGMGESAFRILKELGYQVEMFDMDNPSDIIRLAKSKVDVAFNVCERANDEPVGESYIVAYLEMLGIPQTRCSSSLLAFGIYKPNMKAFFKYHKIPTPKYQIFDNEDEALKKDLSYPLIVKGAMCENSIGMDENCVVFDEDMLRKKIAFYTKNLKQQAIVEEFIDGREFNVAILPGKNPKVLPISEIMFSNLPTHKRVCNYPAKWDTESDIYKNTMPMIPAKVTDQEKRIIEEVSLKCFNRLRCDSYARVDIRFKNNVPYVLEINQNPSIGEQGCGYVNSCKAFGISYSQMIEIILENALNK
ncbi:MAG: ATP-grasp domain-containing protein [archaeon]